MVGGALRRQPAVAFRAAARKATAVSSRGLGRSPLKAQTRVRIPLPLLAVAARRDAGRGAGGDRGPFVYRLGRHPFTVQRGVRFPYGLSWKRTLESAPRPEGVGSAGAAGGAGSESRCPRRAPERGRSSVWLEHSTVTREVAGSSPVGPVTIEGQQQGTSLVAM